MSTLDLEAKTQKSWHWMKECLKKSQFFSGGKDDWQKFRNIILAMDQTERDPAWQEAILLLMHWPEYVLAIFMVLEQLLREWMKEVLESWV